MDYAEEMRLVENKKPVAANSKLAALCPFMDADGIMRIRGRLEKAELNYDQRHPIVLSAKSTLAEKLIAEAHREMLHGGTQQCSQYLRNRFWLIGARRRLMSDVVWCVFDSVSGWRRN